MKTRISAIVLVFVLVSLACHMPKAAPTPAPEALQPPPQALPTQASQPQSAQPQASQPTPTWIKVEGTATLAAGSPGAQQPQSKTGLNGTDACKLYDADKAGQILGEAVIPPAPYNTTGISVCTFFTKTGKGIYVSITMGDQAKKTFLNEIGQYQKGCSVSYSGGTSTATPFPPDIEAMMSKPLLELFEMDLKMLAKCGGKVEALADLGPNAYIIPSALNMGVVAIVSGDNYYSFAFADPKLDIGKMQEKAKEVAQAALSK